MTDILDKIDASLEEVEEQLLAEFNRIRNADSADHSDIDAGIRNALQEVVEQLHDELEHSGDTAHLSLLTERHEVLYARIAVLRQLLVSRVPVAYLREAHEGVKLRRRALEQKVIEQRRREDPSVTRQGEENKRGLVGALKGIFDRKPSDHQLARNAIKVTDEEEKAHGKTQVYLDNGIYSASRELAMLASLIRGGTLDHPPDADMSRSRGKAVFEARELSQTVPPVTRRQPPEAIPEKEDKEAAEISKRDIAQTPEEIRRKLEARRGQTAPGKAIFTAKDIEPAAPPEFRDRRVNKNKDDEHKDDEHKDDEHEDSDDADKRKGPATFEARDLSNAPFPKKD